MMRDYGTEQLVPGGNGYGVSPGNVLPSRVVPQSAYEDAMRANPIYNPDAAESGYDQSVLQARVDQLEPGMGTPGVLTAPLRGIVGSAQGIRQALATPLNFVPGLGDVSGAVLDEQRANDLAYQSARDKAGLGKEGTGARVAKGFVQAVADAGAAALSGVGMTGYLATQGIKVYDSSLKQASEEGLTGWKRHSFAAINAAAEIGTELIGQKLGVGALRAIFPNGAAKPLLTNTFGELLKTGGGEAVEEAVTRLSNNLNEIGHGMKSMSLDNVMDGVGESALIGGLAGGAIGAPGVVQSRGLRQQMVAQQQVLLDQTRAQGPPQPEPPQLDVVQQKAAEWFAATNPEVRDKLADLEEPTRSGFAEAAGIDRSQVPRLADMRNAIVDLARQWRDTPHALPGWQGRNAVEHSSMVREVAQANDLDPHELADRVQGELAQQTQEWDIRRQVQDEITSHYGQLSPVERKQLAEGDEDSVSRLARFDEFVTRFGPETGVTPDLVRDVMVNGVGQRPAVDRSAIEAAASQLKPRPRGEAHDLGGKNVPVQVAPGVMFSPQGLDSAKARLRDALDGKIPEGRSGAGVEALLGEFKKSLTLPEITGLLQSIGQSQPAKSKTEGLGRLRMLLNMNVEMANKAQQDFGHGPPGVMFSPQQQPQRVTLPNGRVVTVHPSQPQQQTAVPAQAPQYASIADVDDHTRGLDDTRTLEADIHDASSRGWDFDTWVRSKPKTVKKYGPEGTRAIWEKFRYLAPGEARQATPTQTQPSREEFVRNAPRAASPLSWEAMQQWIPHHEEGDTGGPVPRAVLKPTPGKPGIRFEQQYWQGGQTPVPESHAINVVARDGDGNAEGILTISLKNGQPDILQVAVRPDVRRQGIATAMFDVAKERFPNLEQASGRGGYTTEGAEFAYGRKSKGGTLGMPAQPNAAHSLDIPTLMRQIEPGADRGSLVAFGEMRARMNANRKRRGLRPMTKEEFDNQILALSKAGVLSLHRSDFVAPLTSQEVAEGHVYSPHGESGGTGDHAKGTYFVGAALRQQPQQQSGDVLNAPPAQGQIFQPPPQPRRPNPTGAHQKHGGAFPQPQATMQSTGAKPMRLEQLWDAVHAVGEVASGKQGKNRVGRMAHRGALGQYNRSTGAQTQGTWGEVTTAAHEAAHRISENTSIVQHAPSAAIAEMKALGHALYTPQHPAPAAGYTKEGFSEFMRMYLTSPADAKSAAPQMYAHMEKTLASDIKPMPDIRNAIRLTQKLGDRWFRGQGAQERLQGQLVNPHSIEQRLKRAVEMTRNLFTKRMLSDIADPLADIDRIVKDLTGHTLRASQSAYQKFKAYRNTPAGIVSHAIDVGVVDRQGKTIGQSLRKALEPILGDFDAFQRYGYALEAIESWKHGQNPGVSLADAQQTAHELKSPERDRAFDALQQWNKDVNKVIGSYDESIRLSLEEAEQLYSIYLPLKRMGEESGGGPSGAGGAKTGTISARKTGSGLPVKEVVAQLVADKAALLKRAMQRDVTITAWKGTQTKDASGKPLAAFSHLIEEVPIPQVLDAQRSVGELVKEIERIGKKYDPNFKLEVDPASRVAVQDIQDQLVKFFGYKDKPGTSEPIIPWRTKNASGGWDTHWLEVKPEMQQLLDSMEPAQLKGVANLLFGVPGRIWKYGAIAASPRFGMLRNPQRDLPEMMQKVPVDMPVAERAKLIPQYFANWGRALAGIDDGWSSMAHGMGLTGSQMLSEHSPSTARLVRRISTSTGQKVLNPRNWVDGLFSAMETYTEKVQGAESASRLVHMRAQAEALGVKPGQPLTEDQSIALALAFKEPMGDYSAKGALFRELDQYLPLASTPITYGRSEWQYGLRRNGQWNKRGIATALATLTIPTIALWLKNRDEEWYKNLSPYEKYSRLYVPMFGTHVLWFRNSEAGMLFSGIPEALFDSSYRKDPEGATDMAKFILGTFAPEQPPLLKEVIDQAANKEEALTGGRRQIVPERGGISKRPAVEQYNDQTSGTAKFLGRLTATRGPNGELQGGISPMRIEHAANTLTGGLSKRTVDTAEALGGAARGKPFQPSDIPVVGGVFPSGGLTGNRPKPVEKVYEALDAARERQASVENPETEPERDRRLVLESAARAMSAMFKEREQAATSDEREAVMKRITAIADRANAGGDKAEFVRQAVASEYRTADDVERTRMLNNRLETLGRVRPALGHNGVTRANLGAKRAEYDAALGAARNFLDDVQADRAAAYRGFEAAVKAKAGPLAMRPSDARVRKLSAVRRALGL